MRFNFKRYAAVAVASTALVAGSCFAQATPIDVSSVTDVMSAAGVAVATIGTAGLSLYYGIKLYKWLKGAGA